MPVIRQSDMDSQRIIQTVPAATAFSPVHRYCPDNFAGTWISAASAYRIPDQSKYALQRDPLSKQHRQQHPAVQMLSLPTGRISHRSSFFSATRHLMQSPHNNSVWSCLHWTAADKMDKPSNIFRS